MRIKDKLQTAVLKLLNERKQRQIIAKQNLKQQIIRQQSQRQEIANLNAEIIQLKAERGF